MRFIAFILFLFSSCHLFSQNLPEQIKPTGQNVPDMPTQQVQALPAFYSAGMPLNLVRTWTPSIPLTSSAAVSSGSRTTAEVKQVTAYIDGLGRPLQTVQKRMTPQSMDVVSAMQYDAFGREVYSYLPFGSLQSNGNFKNAPFAEQDYYYHQVHNANNNNGEAFYYSKTVYEASPLNRVLHQYAPGNSWVGNNRGVSMTYELNAASEVFVWNIAAGQGSLPAMNGYYNSNELYRLVTTDEHGKKVVEYKDKEGRVILKKVQLENADVTAHTGWLCTYYVYDDLGRLRFVIPPKATEIAIVAGNILSTTAHELCFRYEYDQKARMIIKKVPGAGEVKMVYDHRDRLVMTQDANMNNVKWLVSEYDILGRSTRTYLWNNSSDQSTHQRAANEQLEYPTLSGSYELLTETYYDDYSWIPGGVPGIGSSMDGTFQSSSHYFGSINTAPDYAQAVVMSTATKGLITGTKVKKLGSSDYLYTVSFYDDKGRVIQTRANNDVGGSDIVTTQYDFEGKVLRNHHQHVSGTDQITTASYMTYDHAGRLLSVHKNINDVVTKLIVRHSYDELGQLKTKELGYSDNTGLPLEALDHSYNIRGWLTGINKEYALDADTMAQGNKWFGMQLSYDFGFNSEQFNGNIAGIIWKSNGSDRQRAYGFEYDAANRLLKGDFTQNTAGSFNNYVGIDFSTGGDVGTGGTMKYDANGNILEMWQKGLQVSGSDWIDKMGYSYTANSNKLLSVLEGAGIGSTNQQLGDFTDKNTSNDDYLYDDNGNLILDKNKDIANITYNHLNLPHVIIVTGKGTITYTYDARGNKLTKVVDDIVASKVTTTHYVNGFVYQQVTDNNGNQPAVLQFFAHEEGRIRKSLNSEQPFIFDYFIKDHLGNVRMVLTDETKEDVYLATMEDESRELERSVFEGYSYTAKPDCFDEEENKYVHKIGSSRDDDPVIVGLSKTLKVMAGDKINLSVFGWFTKSGGNNSPANAEPLENILASLLAGGINAASGKGLHSQLGSDLFLDGIRGFINKQPANYQSDESAYLNWILLDEEMLHFIDGGYVSLVKDMPGCGVKVLLQAIEGNDIEVGRNGYLFVYLSNTNTQFPVYFDDMYINHKRGPLLEETHYYPFGLTQAGISSKAAALGNPENKKKFNGVEQNTDFDLNIYETFFRGLDPQIGRWWQLDPMMESHFDISPYAYVNNNPLLFADPLGLDTIRTNTPNLTPGFNLDPNIPVDQLPEAAPEVVVTSSKKTGSPALLPLELAGLSFGSSYLEKKLFNNKTWYSLDQWRTYKQRFHSNQYTAKNAKQTSKTASRGLKLFGWGMGLYNQYDIFANDEMSTGQKTAETGVNAVSTFGGIPGAAIGIGWETGRVVTQFDWYRQNVRPGLQDFLGIPRDEVPKETATQKSMKEFLRRLPD